MSIPEPTSDTSPVLLGSLGAELPLPGCGCARCRVAPTRAASRHRYGLRWPGQVDLDGPGPDPTADRNRGDLWLSTRQDDPGRWLPPGERLEHAGLRIISLPTTTPRECALVVADRGRTLLWAPRPSALPAATVEAITDAAFDRVVVSLAGPGTTDTETSGPGSLWSTIGTAHQLARLRSVRAIGPDSTIIGVGLTHDSPFALTPRPDDAAALLHRWGLHLLDDGTPLPPASPENRESAEPGPSGADTPHRVIVLGATSSGKSRIAEALLAAEPAVHYAATGPTPDPGSPDPDWNARIRLHQQRRPDWWHTRESRDLAGLLREEGPPLLVDSLGSWLTATLDHLGAWEDRPEWRAGLRDEVNDLVEAWRQTSRQVVAVAEEVGAGVVPTASSGRLFRDELGRLLQRLTAESEELLVVTAGRIVSQLPPRPGRR